MQATRPKFCVASATVGNESECNTINLWKPYNPSLVSMGAGLPVMVWIHGGSFQTASPGLNVYNGTRLVQASLTSGNNPNGGDSPVIVVSIQYRLGGLGYMAHSKLQGEAGSEGSSGNYGMLDQIAGLQWVRDNIRAFGGDPNSVTIFGESAGAYSVCTLLASPLAVGLFTGAIAESMYCANKYQTQAVAQKAGTWCSLIHSCTNAADELSCLRGLTAAQAWQCDMGSYSGAPVTWGGLGMGDEGYMTAPNIDGFFLLEAPVNAIARGVNVPHVPVLLGSNAAEMMIFTTVDGAVPADQWALADSAFPSMVAKVTAYAGEAVENAAAAAALNATAWLELAPMYTSEDYVGLTAVWKAFVSSVLCPFEPNRATNPMCQPGAVTNAVRRLVAVETDFWFTSTTEMVAAAVSKRALPVFRYLFDQSQTGTGFNALGPYHSLDVPFVFNTLVEDYRRFPGSTVSAALEKMSKDMQLYWLNFARYGDPNGAAGSVAPAGNPTWPRAGNNGNVFMNLTTDGTGFHVGTAFHAEQVNFWKAFAKVPPPEPQPGDTSGSNDNGSSSGAAIGIGVGGGVVFLGVVGFFYYKRMQSEEAKNAATTVGTSPMHSQGEKL